MSATFVRKVVQDYAESNRPGNLDLWPLIRHKVLMGQIAPQLAIGMGSEDPGMSPVSLATHGEVASRKQALSTPRMRRFRVNMAMAMVALLAVAGIAFVFIAGIPTQLASPQPSDTTFLPPGKVRHMIYTGTIIRDGGAQPVENHREEFWVTKENDHVLMRTKVTVPDSIMTWLDNDAYYEYDLEKGNQVKKYPYDEKYLAAVIPDPDILTKTLKLTNARLVGDDVFDGRPVVVVTVDRGAGGTAKYWIDRQTNQLRQVEGVISSSPSGPTERYVNKIALDELINRNELPADFFEFKLPPGATLSP
jgi:outer membrane lipoprotein-sorting protein